MSEVEENTVEEEISLEKKLSKMTDNKKENE